MIFIFIIAAEADSAGVFAKNVQKMKNSKKKGSGKNVNKKSF